MEKEGNYENGMMCDIDTFEQDAADAANIVNE